MNFPSSPFHSLGDGQAFGGLHSTVERKNGNTILENIITYTIYHWVSHLFSLFKRDMSVLCALCVALFARNFCHISRRGIRLRLHLLNKMDNEHMDRDTYLFVCVWICVGQANANEHIKRCDSKKKEKKETRTLNTHER